MTSRTIDVHCARCRTYLWSLQPDVSTEELEKKHLCSKCKKGRPKQPKRKGSNKVELVYAKLGARVKAFRRIKGMTQEDLAELLGLERASVANMETGRQRIYIHYVTALAKIFSVKETEILKGVLK